mmetsp:Transcript_40283/g.64881  ORF Transcript_40283/g.64881 Transcript_40283/m.64881 type:complete len:764 (+) Transcript_40283:2-2293(+)
MVQQRVIHSQGGSVSTHNSRNSQNGAQQPTMQTCNPKLDNPKDMGSMQEMSHTREPTKETNNEEEEVDLFNARCGVCTQEWTENGNLLLMCKRCGVRMHQSCGGYGGRQHDDGYFLCRPCSLGEDDGICIDTKSLPCELCPNLGGAIIEVANKNNKLWVHTMCTSWVPEVYFEDPVELTGAAGLDNPSLLERYRLRCTICGKSKVGACIQCKEEKCYTAFHVSCAVASGLYMQVQGDEKKVSLDCFCRKHEPTRPVDAVADISVLNMRKGPMKPGVVFETLLQMDTEAKKKKKKSGRVIPKQNLDTTQSQGRLKKRYLKRGRPSLHSVESPISEVDYVLSTPPAKAKELTRQESVLSQTSSLGTVRFNDSSQFIDMASKCYFGEFTCPSIELDEDDVEKNSREIQRYPPLNGFGKDDFELDLESPRCPILGAEVMKTCIQRHIEDANICTDVKEKVASRLGPSEGKYYDGFSIQCSKDDTSGLILSRYVKVRTGERPFLYIAILEGTTLRLISWLLLLQLMGLEKKYRSDDLVFIRIDQRYAHYIKSTFQHIYNVESSEKMSDFEVLCLRVRDIQLHDIMFRLSKAKTMNLKYTPTTKDANETPIITESTTQRLCFSHYDWLQTLPLHLDDMEAAAVATVSGVLSDVTELDSLQLELKECETENRKRIVSLLERVSSRTEDEKKWRLDVEKKYSAYRKIAKPTPQVSVPESAVCVVCGNGESTFGNQIVLCDGCEKCYHQKCTTSGIDISKEWFCIPCSKKKA